MREIRFILIFFVIVMRQSISLAQTATGFLSIKSSSTALGCGCTGCNDAVYAGSVTFPDPSGACGTTEPSANSGSCAFLTKIVDFAIPAGCTVNVNACFGDRAPTCSGGTHGPGLDGGDAFRVFGTGGAPNGDSGTITGASNTSTCVAITQVGGTLSFSLTANRVAELLTYTLTYTGPACTPTLLPIDLIHFNVDLQPEEISFEWMTLSEKNASHFEIEYSSDAVLFEKIAVVKAKGQSTEMTKYQKNIPNHFDETGLYFRLKSVDGNGDFSYSPIVFLSYDIRSSFKVGPNPSANGVFVIKQGIRSGSSFQFEIYNTKGVLVKKGQLNQTQTEIDLSEYGSGMHLLHLSAGSQSVVYKLISQ